MLSEYIVQRFMVFYKTLRSLNVRIISMVILEDKINNFWFIKHDEAIKGELFRLKAIISR